MGFQVAHVIIPPSVNGGSTELHPSNWRHRLIEFVHDCNSILTAVGGNIWHARNEILAGKDPSRHLENADLSVQKLGGMLTEHLWSMEESLNSFVQIDLQSVISEVINMFSAIAKERSQVIRVEIKSQLSIFGNESGIRRVIINLLKNAIEASVKPGFVDISAEKIEIISNNHSANDFDDRSEFIPPGRYVKIVISDQSGGIPAAQLFKAFQAISSTKGGLGRGYGLLSVRSIVSSHKGYLSVRVEEKIGTDVGIYFPIQHEYLPNAS